MLFGMVVRFEGVSDGRHCPTPFCPVLAEALIAVCAEPLVCMSLQDRGTRAHDFPSLTSRVARGAQGT